MAYCCILLLPSSGIVFYYLVYCLMITYYYCSIITYYYQTGCSNGPLINRSIIGNNGFIIKYY